MGDVVFETLPQLPMMSDVYLVWRRKSVPEALLDSFQV
jgi:hypothetical protein